MTSQRWKDDLRSAALEGLVQAALRYMPDRSTTFATYTSYLVRWKIGKEKRRLYASRHNKNRIGRECSLDELAAATFDGIGLDSLSCIADFTTDPAAVCEHTADVGAAWDVVDQLPWNDRRSPTGTGPTVRKWRRSGSRLVSPSHGSVSA